MDQLAEFFHEVAKEVIEVVRSGLQTNTVITQKGVASNFATAIDVAVERAIVAKLGLYFPNDSILAEEEYADGVIGAERIWVIDPICGTNNLARQLGPYCTNIALVENGKAVASCVIEHPASEYYWSVGNGAVYKGQDRWQKPEKDFPDKRVDIDLGTLTKADPQLEDRYFRGVRYLQDNTEWMMGSLNTSVEILYVLLGRLDSMVFVNTAPWDAAAGAFLVEQAGGIITGIDGESWTVKEPSIIASSATDVHHTMLEAFRRR